MSRFDQEVQQTIEEFGEVMNTLSRMDVERLPFDLQLSLLNQYAKLTKTIKEISDEMKKIIVMASILERS